MDKFHINGKGEPGACSAKAGACPFGSDEEHFITVKDARESYEKSNEDNTFNLPTVRKNIRKLTEDPNTLRADFMEIANNDDKTVRIGVAESDRCPTEVLDLLSEDKEWEVRQAVARNVATSPDTLQKLANDKHRDVVFAVIHNTRTSVAVLKNLAQDCDPATRFLINADIRVRDNRRISR